MLIHIPVLYFNIFTFIHDFSTMLGIFDEDMNDYVSSSIKKSSDIKSQIFQIFSSTITETPLDENEDVLRHHPLIRV